MTLLALARKVYRHRDWVMVANEAFCVERYTPAIRQDGFTFDPERNPAQLLDVLCWLTTNKAFRSIGRRNINIACMENVQVDAEGRQRMRRIDQQIPHDNTTQSLAAAIVKAACRVAGEEA